MNKTVLAVALIGITSVASAQFVAEGESVSESRKEASKALVSPWKTQSVAEVKNLADDTYVTLEGRLIGYKKEGKRSDDYRFEDSTGEILVEIDDDLWQGQRVTPETKVKILGEFDKSHKKDNDKVEVKYLEVVK